MRYFYTRDTLFVRGSFSAASTGLAGGVRIVSTLLNHTVPADFSEDACRVLEQRVAREGFGPDFFGLLTAVEMRNLCILHYDYIAVFITAGLQESQGKSRTINIIVHSSQGLNAGAQLGAVITVCDAKAEALRCLGYDCSGTPTDAVIVACEGEAVHEFAGPLSETGRRIHEAVLVGVQEAVRRHTGAVQRSAPSMFIYSRYGGDHWAEWSAQGCPYYPCHFAGQRCELCYCPLYPCGDTTLGEYVESMAGGKVWSCAGCSLVHRPEVVEYLLEHPEAPLAELKRVSMAPRRSAPAKKTRKGRNDRKKRN
jgi:adenosylcobinamide hydrolase